LHVAGDNIESASGTPVLLLGFDDSAASSCIQPGGSVFVNGLTAAQQVQFVSAWRGNTARISLNEDCWLGINGAPVAFSAATYQETIEAAVMDLHRAGYYVILDLHWNAPGQRLAKGQEVMADADHSPTFWSSVAGAFRSDGDTLFELYNEPHGISWPCWAMGCVVPQGWRTAGMQTLVYAVRRAGSHQILLLGGLSYSNDLSQWIQYRPRDELHQVAAALHVHNVDPCVSQLCWDATVAPTAQDVPVVATEIGERDQGSALVDSFVQWANQHRVSYLGWEFTRPYATALKQDFAQEVQHTAGS
jgi:hypothetical protein